MVFTVDDSEDRLVDSNRSIYTVMKSYLRILDNDSG